MVTPNEELAKAVERIIGAAHGALPKYKAAASDLVRVLTDAEWTKLSEAETRRRARNARVTAVDAAKVDLHDVVAQFPALEKIQHDLDYRLPGSGRPLANIALTREQAIELLT